MPLPDGVYGPDLEYCLVPDVCFTSPWPRYVHAQPSPRHVLDQMGRLVRVLFPNTASLSSVICLLFPPLERLQWSRTVGLGAEPFAVVLLFAT